MSFTKVKSKYNNTKHIPHNRSDGHEHSPLNVLLCLLEMVKVFLSEKEKETNFNNSKPLNCLVNESYTISFTIGII